MSTLLTRTWLHAAIICSLAAATVTAQTLASLADMAGDLAAGKEVKVPVRYNSAGGIDSPLNSRIYGDYPIYMADGEVTLKKDTIAFRATVGSGSFSVQPEKILAITNEPAAGSRIHIEVAMANPRNKKEERKSFYWYNPNATGVGDGAVGGPGASIVCNGCDDSMEKLYALLMRIRSGEFKVTGLSTSTSPSSGAIPSAATMTNEDVLQLVGAGPSTSVITTAIQQAKDKRFELGPSALIALKKANVPDAVILAMQSSTPAPAVAKPEPPAAPIQTPPPPRTPQPAGCTGIENMGLYKDEIFDRAVGGGVVEWLAKIRNNTPVTKIVIFGWRDQYGQEKRGQVQGTRWSHRLSSSGLDAGSVHHANREPAAPLLRVRAVRESL